VAGAALGDGGGFGGGPEPLAQGTATILVGVWLLGSLAVAALFAERAEITG
jgi:hypothetical protein